jgi:hypothetical protein
MFGCLLFQFEKIAEEGGPGEFLFELGIYYLCSTIKRILSKAYRGKRQDCTFVNCKASKLVLAKRL